MAVHQQLLEGEPSTPMAVLQPQSGIRGFTQMVVHQQLLEGEPSTRMAVLQPQSGINDFIQMEAHLLQLVEKLFVAV